VTVPLPLLGRAAVAPVVAAVVAAAMVECPPPIQQRFSRLCSDPEPGLGLGAGWEWGWEPGWGWGKAHRRRRRRRRRLGTRWRRRSKQCLASRGLAELAELAAGHSATRSFTTTTTLEEAHLRPRLHLRHTRTLVAVTPPAPPPTAPPAAGVPTRPPLTSMRIGWMISARCRYLS
jgi:hypothetical protein